MPTVETPPVGTIDPNEGTALRAAGGIRDIAGQFGVAGRRSGRTTPPPIERSAISCSSRTRAGWRFRPSRARTRRTCSSIRTTGSTSTSAPRRPARSCRSRTSAVHVHRRGRRIRPHAVPRDDGDLLRGQHHDRQRSAAGAAGQRLHAAGAGRRRRGHRPDLRHWSTASTTRRRFTSLHRDTDNTQNPPCHLPTPNQIHGRSTSTSACDPS